jgi:hypothetical protein
MATITKQLRASDMEAMAGQAEGTTEAVAAKEEACIDKFHRFETMEELLLEFLDSNDMAFSMADLQQLKAGDIWYLQFFHCSIPYLATVKMLRLRKKLQLQIKLPDDGFVYTDKPGTSIARHNSDTWISLPTMVKYLPNLIEMLPDHPNGRFFYNYGAQRVDILLQSPNPFVPNIMVTYEPGFPYRDDADDDTVVQLHHL